MTYKAKRKLPKDRRRASLATVLAVLMVVVSFSLVLESQTQPASAAGTLAPAEPSYPIASTVAPWTSTNGLITMTTTRTQDGTSCSLNNTRTTAVWDAANGGDGGNGDGRVCLPSINATPADSSLAYSIAWSVNATAGNQVFAADFPNWVVLADFQAICSNKAGIYTVTSVSNSARSCSITALAGAVRSGTWTLGADFASSSLGYGYQTPTMNIASRPVSWPSYNILNVPTPTLRTAADYEGTTNGSVEWVRRNGQFTARWHMSVMTPRLDSNPISLNTSSLPGAVVTRLSYYMGGYRFRIDVPYESLSSATGSAGVFAENWAPIDGIYTTLTPYGGVLPIPGYGQPETTQTGNSASQVGYGGALNETWAALSWSNVSGDSILDHSATINPGYIRPNGKTTLEYRVSLQEPNAQVTTLCAEYGVRFNKFDSTRTATVTDAFGNVVNLAPTLQDGTCDGSNIGTSTSVILKAPSPATNIVLNSDSIFRIPVLDVGKTGNAWQDSRGVGVCMTTPVRRYCAGNNYTIGAATRNLTGQVNLPESVDPGSTNDGTVGYNSDLLSTVPEDFPMSVTTTATFSIDRCFADIQFNPPAGTTIVQTGSPNFIQGVPRCRGGDTGAWTYTATTNLYLADGNTSRATTIPFTFDVPSSARPQTVAEVVVQPDSMTVPYEEWSPLYKSAGRDITSVNSNPDIVQEVYQDALQVEVGNRAGWTMIASNSTGQSGSGTFIYEFSRSQPYPVQMSDIQLTASGNATLSMVSTSTNQITWTPWNPAATTVPQFIRMEVPNLTDGWEGSLHLSFDTDGTRPGSEPRIRAIGGNASFFTTVVGTTWKEVLIYVNAPAIDLIKTVVDETVVDANSNGVDDKGDRIDYELSVANIGIFDLTNIDLTDSITTVTCPDTTLAVGEKMMCQASYTLTQADIENGSVVNNATVSGESIFDGQVVNSSSSATQAVVQVPLISFSKSADKSLLMASGDQVEYVFTVTNTGNLNVSGLRITDAMLGWSNIICETGLLAPEASAECSAVYTSTSDDFTNGGFTNTASVKASTVAGPLTRSDSWTVVTPTEHGDPSAPIRVSGGL